VKDSGQPSEEVATLQPSHAGPREVGAIPTGAFRHVATDGYVTERHSIFGKGQRVRVRRCEHCFVEPGTLGVVEDVLSNGYGVWLSARVQDSGTKLWLDKTLTVFVEAEQVEAT